MDVLPTKKRLDAIALFAECFEKLVVGELGFFFGASLPHPVV